MKWIPCLNLKRRRNSLLKMLLGLSALSAGVAILTTFRVLPGATPRQSGIAALNNMHYTSHFDHHHSPPSASANEGQQQQQQQQRHQQLVFNSSSHSSNNKAEGSLQLTEQRMKQRLHHAQEFCANTKDHGTPKNNPLCSPRHQSDFCIMGKVGSTFWTRFYKTLRMSSSDVIPSPYDLPLSTGERCGKASPAISPDVGARPGVKVVFVRDPFQRVVSAYVDKLVSPNPTFWSFWGKPSMLFDRAPTACGQSVTFRQFFRYVIQKLHDTDGHIKPMIKQCNPCSNHVRYDVIGKMETLPEDMGLLMSMLNVSFSSTVRLSEEGKLDAITDSIQGPFSWKSSIKKCISTQEMGRKIWRKLQIRGLISCRIDYPLGTQDLTSMSADQFFKLAAEAHRNSTDKEELAAQKRQAFVEAFRSVDSKDVEGFVKVFQDDFLAFGYNTSLGDLGGDSFEDSHAFDFNKLWVLPSSSRKSEKGT